MDGDHFSWLALFPSSMVLKLTLNSVVGVRTFVSCCFCMATLLRFAFRV